MRSHYDLTKTTEIDIYDFGKYNYKCLYFNEADFAAIGTDLNKPRVEALIDDSFHKGALMPDKVGSDQTKHLIEKGWDDGSKVWYLMVSKKTLSSLGKQVGDNVEVSLRLGDQDEVEMCLELQEMLASDQDLNEIWESLTPGKQRSLAHRVNSAKTTETLEKRLIELTELLMDL